MTVHPSRKSPLPAGSKFVKWEGRLCAVQNWQHREHGNDAVIVRPLDHGQADFYSDGKRDGRSDTSIYFHIFPTPKKSPASDYSPKHKISVDIEILNKDQLIKMIEKQTGTPIKGLCKLDRSELESILLALQKSRRD